MRTVTHHWLRFASAGLLVLVIAASAVIGVTLATGGGVHEVDLEGVPAGEFRALGARLLEPDGEPVISDGQAVSVALQNKFRGDVRETRLVRLVNDSARPRVDTLAWAVNFDPATVSRIPGLGEPLYQEKQPKPSASPANCGVFLMYDVTFVDAMTGEWLFEVQQSGSGEPNEDGTCPATPVNPPASDSTQAPDLDTSTP